ncbi:hypothetical protein [Candidatus Amarolinea dominans]|uniref:sulfurtransferase TusA family protein n=1 Tax=Candidatus Amarolinea dominans TaxID=3140696 RepID=UPI003136317B|nr:hypothetical protein [Anaerolineae bacterium]
MTTGIANAVGVRRTETCLVVWYGQGQTPSPAVEARPAIPAVAPIIASAPAPGVVIGSLLGADAFYNAGSKGCADGPLDDIAAIMAGLHAAKPEIHATDASVAVDLAAWCRMTGNVLLDQRGSRHLVRRQEQPSR